IPAAIEPILTVKRAAVEIERATTAVFYSISNCQRGLAGVSFGHFLIKQVGEEVSRELPRLRIFVTLSPSPGLAEWPKRGPGARPGVRGGARRRAAASRPAGLGPKGGDHGARARAADARGRLVFPARAHAARHAARCGGALPSRQRRAARATQSRGRHLGAGD